MQAAFITELSGILLQQQRFRLTSFMSRVFSNFHHLPSELQERFKANAATEAGERIIETAWNQAAASVDPEKLDCIAALVKSSLSSNELAEHQTRCFLLAKELREAGFTVDLNQVL